MAAISETHIGRRLAVVRLRRELSQGTVARRAGIAASYLSRLETGKVQRRRLPDVREWARGGS